MQWKLSLIRKMLLFKDTGCNNRSLLPEAQDYCSSILPPLTTSTSAQKADSLSVLGVVRAAPTSEGTSYELTFFFIVSLIFLADALGSEKAAQTRLVLRKQGLILPSKDTHGVGVPPLHLGTEPG